MGRSMNLIEFNTPPPPTQDLSIDDSTAFNWSGLPTELKEMIISNCVHQPLEHNDKYSRQHRYYHNRSKRDQARGMYQIVDKLSNWAALLGVSHQVRAITLRLCFTGSSEMNSDKGFNIYMQSRYDLLKTLDGLASFYCMVETGSLPRDDKTRALADCYNQYPKIYTHLYRYATFLHGIRRICLGFRFHDTMHFFKVTAGGFARHLNPDSISYDIFEQLPHLKEIAVKLPAKPRTGWSNMRQPLPMLFHEDFPCPRTLHRLIYERIAEVLALYPDVRVHGFIDNEEEARYKEYEELYAECGGGVELEEPVQPGFWSEETAMIIEEAADDFFPPDCKCAEKCHLLLYK